MTHSKKLLPMVVLGFMYLNASAAHANTFNNVVVFGDSLSDSGNVGLLTANTPSKYTTNPGKTAVEVVAEGLGFSLSPSLVGGTNFAWGGAGVSNSLVAGIPTLPQQLNSYLASTNGKADSQTLYQVWGGANDIFGLVQNPINSTIQIAAGATTAATAEIGLLSSLKAAGAHYVVVYNLPNMGLTPSALEQGASAAAGLTQISSLYNSTLNAGISSLSAAGLNVIPVDVYGLLNEVVANPAAYGFSNVTNEACGKGSSSVQCGPAGSAAAYTYAAGTQNSYLFADGVHPTAATHQLLAQAALAELTGASQMTLLSEAPLSITNAQSRAMKTEMLNDADGKETRVFVNLDYNHQKLKATQNTPQLSTNNVNLTFGSDAKVNDQISAGVGMSLNQQDGSFSGDLGKYSLFDVSALGYALYHKDDFYVGGFANAGSLHFNNIKRRIHLGNTVRVETSDAQGYHVGGGVDGGYWFNFKDIKTGPFVHAEWQTIKVDDFAEDGVSSTAMKFGDQQRDSFVTTAGWRLKGDWDYKKTTLSPFAEVAWNHDFQTRPGTLRAGLNTMSGNFETAGFAPEKDWGSVSVGLSSKYANNMTAWVLANTDFSHATANNLGLNVGMKYAF